MFDQVENVSATAAMLCIVDVTPLAAEIPARLDSLDIGFMAEDYLLREVKPATNAIRGLYTGPRLYPSDNRCQNDRS